MIFKHPSLLTRLEIWSPRYKDKYGDLAEPVVLLAQYKVANASPWILVEFTKAKHLLGQRYCIRREAAERSIPDTNGKIPCYAVPLSKFEGWDSVADIHKVIAGFGW